MGKTAIAEGLGAHDRREPGAGTCCWTPPFIRSTWGSLVAGTKYRGRFRKTAQGRAGGGQEAAGRDPLHRRDSHRDRRGRRLGRGDGRIESDQARAGERRTCAAIGSTTYNEYRGIFEKDHALARRFQKIDITEPSVSDTVDILRGLKSRYEEHHGISTRTMRCAPPRNSPPRHINDRHMPDKAIDVVDEAGANLRLQPVEKRASSVTVTQIENVVARIARIPPKNVSLSDRTCSRISSAIEAHHIRPGPGHRGPVGPRSKMSRSGLGDQRKPVGSFLFSGPTGVGKTEVTRQLAIAMGVDSCASTCPNTWSGIRCRASSARRRAMSDSIRADC